MVPRRSPVHLFLGFVLMTGAATDARAVPAPQDAARWAKMAVQELRDSMLPFWLTHAPNPNTGGFYGIVDGSLKPRPEAPRGALLTTRVLWTFSSAYRLYGDKAYRAMAQRAYEDLIQNFWDDEDERGGLFWTIAANGEPLDTRKQVYGQVFGIYALSEYYRATGKKEALTRAKELYRLVETHAGDRDRGGYFEACTRDWDLLSADVRSVMGAPTVKSQNTHLHILEAYTNLLKVWPDPELRKRQLALIEVMVERILDSETGHLVLFQDADWTVRSDGISFGHDIEAAWLLTEAAEVVGDDGWIERTREIAVALAEVTMAEGVDADGAVFNEAGPNGITDDNKDWWPQAEATVGFLNAYQITGDLRFLKASRQSWEFIQSRLVDREHGGWFHSVDRDGNVRPRNRIDLWTCPYHSARSCMELSDRLSAMTNQERE